MASHAQQLISGLLTAQGLEHWGFAALANPVSLSVYREWLKDGFHGEMGYLERHLTYKEEPEKLLPRARSALIVAFRYMPHPQPRPLPDHKGQSLRVALYAQGDDYHDWIQERLEKIIATLQVEFPHEVFLPATDSKPVLERDLAYKAGLGWFGKNTCLIDQKRGSLFLLGEILTSLELEPAQALHPDRCGTCTRCLDACPTQAIVAPRQIDARRCISYLTIESKAVPPLGLRTQMGDHFFGCDICQTVCPWNEKAFGVNLMRPLQPALREPRKETTEDLRFILTSSNKQLEKHFAASPLGRARGFGLKRNALIVAANQRLSELRPEVENLRSDSRLGELAEWTLTQWESL